MDLEDEERRRRAEEEEEKLREAVEGPAEAVARERVVRAVRRLILSVWRGGREERRKQVQRENFRFETTKSKIAFSLLSLS